jgi:uncharacterized protein (TIGR03083 family)
MATRITEDRWNAVRAALKEASDRFVEVVAGAPDATAAATRDWSIADTAAHVASVAWLDAMMLLPDLEPPPVPGLAERLDHTSVDGVHGLNALVLRHLTERDPKVLTAGLSEHIARMLDGTEGTDPAEPTAWLGGSRAPRAGILAHMLNELLIHGRDIAHATGVPWTIAPQDAAHFFQLFFVELGYNGVGELLAGGGKPRARRIAVEFRSDFTTPVTIVLQNGRVTIEPPDSRPDVKISFDPTVVCLMLFGRISKARAVLTRGVVVTGRRPWLLPIFLRTVRTPS